MSNPVRITLSIQENSHTIELGFKEIIRGGDMLPWYDGAYSVTPRKVEQTLETDHKSMRDDVVVEAIYRADVENPSGGYTVTIGNE